MLISWFSGKRQRTSFLNWHLFNFRILFMWNEMCDGSVVWLNFLHCQFLCEMPSSAIIATFQFSYSTLSFCSLSFPTKRTKPEMEKLVDLVPLFTHFDERGLSVCRKVWTQQSALSQSTKCDIISSQTSAVGQPTPFIPFSSSAQYIDLCFSLLFNAFV